MTRGWQVTPAAIHARMDRRIEFDPFGGCWLWSGTLGTGGGYGIIQVRRRQMKAHRVMYERFVGPIPAGLVIDHKCRVRCCVNPAHLRAVTYRINALENSIGIAAANVQKTHCPKGHPYSGASLISRPDHLGRPRRNCRLCARARNAAYKRRLRRVAKAVPA